MTITIKVKPLSLLFKPFLCLFNKGISLGVFNVLIKDFILTPSYIVLQILKLAVLAVIDVAITTYL